MSDEILVDIFHIMCYFTYFQECFPAYVKLGEVRVNECPAGLENTRMARNIRKHMIIRKKHVIRR